MNIEKDKKNRWFIKKLQYSSQDRISVICSLDVETIKLNSDTQLPIAISFAYSLNNEIKSFYTLIDPILLKLDSEKAILNLWEKFYDKLISLDLGTSLKIYSHNLGSFDGYFILNSLFNYWENPKDINPLIDDRN